MAEKKLNELPTSYANLGFDKEPVPGPSAPLSQEQGSPSVSSNSFEVNAAVKNTRCIPSAPSNEIALEDTQENDRTIPDFNPPPLVFEDIYDACARYVDDNCCYGSKFINRMKLTNINNTRTLRYILESYGEMRELKFGDKPYKGGAVDGPDNGPVPHVWDLEVRRPNDFKDDWTNRDIPHTEEVSTCSRCGGDGEETCWRCNGSSYVSCSRCSGSGYVRNSDDEDESCGYCSGSGTESCFSCSSGKVTCSKCDGYKEVIDYKWVKVIWTNHRAEYNTNTGNLPRNLVLKSKPTVLFQELKEKVQPIFTPEASMNAACVRLLQKHENDFPNELIFLQRHFLLAVPFSQVKYSWKDREGEFYLYGLDRNVYFEHYPQKYCCCTCC